MGDWFGRDAVDNLEEYKNRRRCQREWAYAVSVATVLVAFHGCVDRPALLGLASVLSDHRWVYVKEWVVVGGKTFGAEVGGIVA